MKFLVLFISIFFFASYTIDLPTLREEYPKALNDLRLAESLYKELQDTANKSPLINAYKGGVATLMAKHAKAVKDKKKYFLEGRELLEGAVSAQPDNVEIRCLRLGVQENSPKIMKYKDRIAEDKKFIMEHLSKVGNPEIYTFISNFIKASEVFSPSEKKEMGIGKS